MGKQYSVEIRNAVLNRYRSGEPVTSISSASGIALCRLVALCCHSGGHCFAQRCRLCGFPQSSVFPILEYRGCLLDAGGG